MSAPRFRRSDTGGATEVLTLVRLTGDRSGETFASADLDAEYPYLVQVTAGPDVGDDFVGLYDLDGDLIDPGNAEWELASDAPPEVLEQIETGWASGTSWVERLVGAS